MHIDKTAVVTTGLSYTWISGQESKGNWINFYFISTHIFYIFMMVYSARWDLELYINIKPNVLSAITGDGNTV